MKYHKIRNVPQEVCTAEQVTAYNLASSYALDLASSSKFQSFAEMAQYIITHFYTNGKYDADIVFCALNAGIETFCKAKYHILTSYAEIGEMFPANYRENNENKKSA